MRKIARHYLCHEGSSFLLGAYYLDDLEPLLATTVDDGVEEPVTDAQQELLNNIISEASDAYT
jgi:hypothetical protein